MKPTLILLSALSVLAMAATGVQAQVRRQPEGLTIFFTGDSDAQISSCGCPEADYGGVTRRAAFLDTLRTEGWEFLTVDAGGVAPFKPLDDTGRLKTEVMARAMAVMRYDAVALGDVDLAPGPEFVAQLVGWLGRPVVATNFDLPKGQSERSRVVRVRGRRVGVVAFLDTTLARTEAPWLTVEPWEAQRERVRSLEARSDVLVALVTAPDSTALLRLGTLYPEIAVFIGAYRGHQIKTFETRGVQAFMSVSPQGKWLGRADLTFPPGAPPTVQAAFLAVRQEWGHRPAVDDLIGDYSRRVKGKASGP